MVSPKKEKHTPLPPYYSEFLSAIKERIRQSRIRAYRSCSVNRGLIDLYWSIGKEIVERQRDVGRMVARLLEFLGENLDEVVSFGSRARGDARSGPGVDFLGAPDGIN